MVKPSEVKEAASLEGAIANSLGVRMMRIGSDPPVLAFSLSSRN